MTITKMNPKVTPKGTGHYNHTLTEDDVTEIRGLYNEGGVSYAHLAKMFNVSRQAIFKVVNRITWKHVK